MQPVTHVKNFDRAHQRRWLTGGRRDRSFRLPGREKLAPESSIWGRGPDRPESRIALRSSRMTNSDLRGDRFDFDQVFRACQCRYDKERGGRAVVAEVLVAHGAVFPEILGFGHK